MQAIILAAGRGSRLGEQAGGTPKPLLEISRRPLVEHQIEALAGCGIGPVCMVVGFGADDVREAVGIKAEYVRNPRWNVTNSLYSFWLARDWVKEDVLVLNCDVLFAPEMIERLLDVPGDAIAYDSSSGERREEMSVRVENGLLRDMSKTLPPGEVSGENVGMLKLSLETARAIFARAGELVAEGREKEWLGSAVRDVAQQRPIRAVDIHGLPWAEIDFPADLARARKVTWPAIQAASRRRSRPLRALRWAAALVAGVALAVASYSAWIAPHDTVWETVEATGPLPVAITNGVQHRPWLLMREGESAAVTAEGPTVLRVYVRPLFDDPAATTANVVLKLSLDGHPAGLQSLPAGRSRTWTLDGAPVGKQVKFELEIPQGAHAAEVTLSAAESKGCLLRFVELAPDA
jgi:L-glutamine-phosphate cytidylyltransferase